VKETYGAGKASGTIAARTAADRVAMQRSGAARASSLISIASPREGSGRLRLIRRAFAITLFGTIAVVFWKVAICVERHVT
jgi:hypothetical protein